MTHYIQFPTADGGTILVEVEEVEVEEAPTPTGGLVKAGLKEDVAKKAQKVIDQAQDTFEDGLEVIRRNANAFIEKVRDLTDPPDEVEVTFGLKATGEAGNFAIAKAGMEANYTVKLVWKREQKRARATRKTIGTRVARRRGR